MHGRLYIERVQQPQHWREGAPPVGLLQSCKEWLPSAIIPDNNGKKHVKIERYLMYDFFKLLLSSMEAPFCFRKKKVFK